MYLNNTPQRTVAFPFQYSGREGAKMLCYTYISYLVSPVSYESYTPTTSHETLCSQTDAREIISRTKASIHFTLAKLTEKNS
jgi:hypothetical protein